MEMMPSDPTLDEVLGFAKQYIGQTTSQPEPIEPGFAEWWWTEKANSRNNGFSEMKCWKVGLVNAWKARLRKMGARVTTFRDIQPANSSRKAQLRDLLIKRDTLKQKLKEHPGNPERGLVVGMSRGDFESYLNVKAELDTVEHQLALT